jgi:hypothetical protein
VAHGEKIAAKKTPSFWLGVEGADFIDEGK